MNLEKYKTGYFGRVLRGKSDEDFRTLTNDPDRKVVMVIGADGISSLDGKASREILSKIGYTTGYVDWLLKGGVRFKFAAFKNNDELLPATWENSAKIVKELYPLVYDKFSKWTGQLETTSFADVEKAVDFNFAEVNKAGKNNENYMTYDRYVDAPDTLLSARSFAYFALQLRELFAGDGYTYDEHGNKCVREYFMKNRPLSELKGIEVIDLSVRLARNEVRGTER